MIAIVDTEQIDAEARIKQTDFTTMVFERHERPC